MKEKQPRLPGTPAPPAAASELHARIAEAVAALHRAATPLIELLPGDAPRLSMHFHCLGDSVTVTIQPKAED